MGEHGEWEKKSNFDLVVKVPLLIRAPWKAAGSAGRRTAALVDLVDVGVTVAVLAGLPPPPGVDGEGVSALLKNMANSTPAGSTGARASSARRSSASSGKGSAVG